MIRNLKSKVRNDPHFKEMVMGSAITFVLKISGMLLGYIVIYLISKKNGAEGVGYYSLINQLLLLLGVIATLGMNVSVLRYVGQFTKTAEESQIKNLYRSILKLSLPTSIVLGILTYLIAPFLAEKVFTNRAYTEAIQWTALALPFFTLNSIGVEYIRGLKRLKISEFIRSVSRPLVLIICIAYFWSQEISNMMIIYFFIGGIVVNSLMSNGTIWRHLSQLKTPKINQIQPKELLLTSTPMMITAIASTLISAFSIFLLDYFGNTEEVGVYSVAFRISQLIAIVLVVVNTIVAPTFSKLFWSKQMAELQKVIDQSTKLILFGSITLAFLVVALSSFLLDIFGSEFSIGQWALIVLVIGQVVNAMTGSVTLLLNMSGKQGVLRNVALIALLIQILLSFALIPPFGILGASISSTISLSFWNIICTLIVQKQLQLRTYYIPFIKRKKTN